MNWWEFNIESTVRTPPGFLADAQQAVYTGMQLPIDTRGGSPKGHYVKRSVR